MGVLSTYIGRHNLQVLRKAWEQNLPSLGHGGRRFATNGSSPSEESANVVFLRHGQSLWNKIPTFSGWCDVPLTSHGVEQAREAGKLLSERDFEFDIAYTSELQRARITCETAIESIGSDIPMTTAWQLNERHYGKLQGRAKKDPALFSEYGEEQLVAWRREFYDKPPPMDETHPYFEPDPAPRTESLADCQERVLKYWGSTIVPSLLPGQNALFVAHANTLRAMIAYLDKVEPENVSKIHVPNSVPCIYQIDLNTGMAISTHSVRTEESSRGHWLLSEANQERLVDKLGGSSESFARSIFDAWDKDSDGVLTRDELQNGLYSWKNNDHALSALVGKVWEELHKVGDSGPITLATFQKYADLSAKKHNLPFFLAN